MWRGLKGLTGPQSPWDGGSGLLPGAGARWGLAECPAQGLRSVVPVPPAAVWSHNGGPGGSGAGSKGEEGEPVTQDR